MEKISEQAKKDAETIWENELKNPFLENINQSILEIIESLDSKLYDYDKKLNTLIKEYTLLSQAKDELKTKKIEIGEIKKTYVKLNLINDANPLINLIIQCLTNLKSFSAYYLNSEKEEKILSKSKKDPNGVYLGPSYMQLLKDMWGDEKKEHTPRGIHKVLKELMKDNYKSNNSGYITEFILSQLYMELNPNNDQQVNLQYFKNSKVLPNNKILYSSYPYMKNDKICLSCNAIVDSYFSCYPVINIYLDEKYGRGKAFNLENNLNELLIERGKDIILESCPFCKQQRIKITKCIYQESDIIIFHIDRKNDPNYNISLCYEKKMTILEKEYSLFSVIKDIPTNIYDYPSYIAYIRSFYNHYWYSYDNKNITLYEDENAIFDENDKYASLLIYCRLKVN